MARVKVSSINVPGINVWADIHDRTGLAGLTAQAIKNLTAAATAAARAGLTDFVITAGKGEGHISHGGGTEFDAKAYRNGRLWTPEERVAVAIGARKAGADRFGLYSFGDGYTGNGTIHIGYSGPGRPAAVWGYLGKVRGAESRLFQNDAEKAFLAGKTPAFVEVPDPFGVDRLKAAMEGGYRTRSEAIAAATDWRGYHP